MCLGRGVLAGLIWAWPAGAASAICFARCRRRSGGGAHTQTPAPRSVVACWCVPAAGCCGRWHRLALAWQVVGPAPWIFFASRFGTVSHSIYCQCNHRFINGPVSMIQSNLFLAVVFRGFNYERLVSTLPAFSFIKSIAVFHYCNIPVPSGLCNAPNICVLFSVSRRLRS